MRILFVRRIILLVVLVAFIASGCSYFAEKRRREAIELLPVRNVRVVPFPVRPLEFMEPRVKQEKDVLTISGSLKNVSYSPVANAQVRAVIFFAMDETAETLNLAVVPSVLQPGETGEFVATGLVEQPVSHVELHLQWEEFYPPGL